MNPEDSLLVTRLRAGDRQAFKQVYERYKGDVLALTAAMLGRQDAAWDVLHDVFVSLARRAPYLAPSSNLKGYLLTSAANRARDLMRKRAPEPLAGDDAGEAPCVPAEDPADAAGRAEEAGLLWRAVAALPDEQRLVVALHVYGGLSLSEIAVREGVSENTVQSRYRYAVEKLRRSFSGDGP